VQDPGWGVARDRGPPIVVDAAVAEHLEVLRPPAVAFGPAVERIAHAHTLDRALLDTVDSCWLREACGLEHRGCNVDHMMKLRADLALRLDPARPVHDRAVTCTAPVRGDLLRPLVGRIHRVRPTDGVVVVGGRRAEL